MNPPDQSPLSSIESVTEWLGMLKVGDVAVGQQRLATLGEQPQLQQIACDKMAGYNNAEIAERLACSVRSVERHLNLIRKLWTSDQSS